jgi:hypothetical protein
MRLLLISTALCLLLAGTASAQGGTKIANPQVNGLPVDHCADIDASPDCTAKGEAKAALNACIANGYAAATGWHVRAASGKAAHFITEYDMHAGEVGGRWEPKPASGTFDWIACKK